MRYHLSVCLSICQTTTPTHPGKLYKISGALHKIIARIHICWLLMMMVMVLHCCPSNEIVM